MRFLILATPRVGSTLMVEYLHPFCHHEIWHPKRRDVARDFTDLHPERFPREYLDAWCRHDPTKSGAKVMTDALPLDRMRELVASVDRVIHMRRRNVTEQVVSFKLAQYTGRFSWRDSPGDPDWVEPVELPIGTLEYLAERWVRDSQGLTPKLCHESPARRKRWFYTLWYEDLVPDVGGPRWQEVRRLLGFHPVDAIQTRLRVQRSEERYRRLLLNYDAINDAMGERYGVLFGAPGRCWDE